MPILDDISDHEVIGRERKIGMAMGFKKGLEEGFKKGFEEGFEEGLDKGTDGRFCV